MWPTLRTFVLTLLFSSPVLPQVPDIQPPPVRFSVPIEVVGPKGRPVPDLGAADLTLTVGGAPWAIGGLTAPRAAEPWRIVLYFDRILSGTRSLRAAADALIEQLPALVVLGEVELVIAEPEPREVVPPTRSAAALEEALAQIFLSAEGRDDLRQARARFAAKLEGGSAGGREGADAAEALAAEERTALRQQDRWLDLLARSPLPPGAVEEGARALILVSDGYDLDPAPAYGVRRSVVPPLVRASSAMARAAAELGWSVFVLRLGDEKLPDPRRWSLDPARGGVRVRLPESGPAAVAGPALPVLVDPAVPLAALAQATGAAMARERAEVGALVASLGRRQWISWDAPPLSPGSSVAIEVRAKLAERSVRAPAWVGSGMPAEVAAARGRALLSGEDLSGDFDLRAIETGAPADPSAGAAAPGVSRGLPTGIEARIEPLEGDPTLRFTRLVDLFAAPEVLAAPERTTGGGASEDGSLEGGAPVQVVAWPVGNLVGGGARGGVLVADDPATGRLGAVLIERQEPAAAVIAEVETAGPPPGRGTTAPSSRPKGGLAVRILRPLPGKADGPVEVEAEVKTPTDARLDRVEFFWNDELAATAYQPPFRRAVPVPRGGPVGFLRVAARLADGTVVDDAVLMNAGASGERVDVRLVEVPVVVTDRAGRPVRGLVRSDFRLKRNGVAQEIAGFADAGDLPLTLALAVDSSASMFLKLPRVERAARSLLLEALNPRDRALLVDFDSVPRLVARPTRDLAGVANALSSLRADGGTALWSAVVFGLRELGGVAGRKALVVYSDGVGEEDPTSYSECLRAARASRVPVYLILSSSVSARRAGSLLREPLGEKLDRLARATGGAAIFLDASLGADPGSDSDLSAVYRGILAELRSQYLLTFYPPEGSGESWQNLDLEVRKPGLSARALEGYTPRRWVP